MDPALLRERELFKRKALSTPTVEKKKKDSDNVSAPKEEKKKPKSQNSASTMVNYKVMTGSSQYKFGVLAKIVKHMKGRHQEGDDHPLSMDEILDETNQLDVGSKVKQPLLYRQSSMGVQDHLLFEPGTNHCVTVGLNRMPRSGTCKIWLLSEALVNNPKIEVTQEGKFVFKAPYKIKDKKNLLRLLKQHDLKGLGGILLEDIQESLPFCDKALKSLQNEIIYITRPMDKKKIVFYNDKTANFQVDEEFQKLWRAVAVESMDDQKIDEYLEKQGIRSMQDHGLRKSAPIKRKKANQRKKQLKKPRDNEHLADLLEDYDEK